MYIFPWDVIIIREKYWNKLLSYVLIRIDREICVQMSVQFKGFESYMVHKYFTDNYIGNVNYVCST
jgi:hypothetical protein